MALPALPARPLVSVIMANRNYGRFLPDAIGSVLAQTYPELELIVVDDGSSDDSRTVLADHARQDQRLVVVHGASKGQASAWNGAFDRARGAVIAFLDADDRFVPHKLERLLAAFARPDRPGVVWHRFQPVTEDGVAVGLPFPRELEHGWLAEACLARGGHAAKVVSSALACRREVAAQIFPLPRALDAGAADAYIQAAARFLTASAAIREPLTDYRIHGANVSASAVPTVAVERRRVEALRQRVPLVRDFLARRFGAEVAGRLRLEDNPEYWRHLAALYVLLGRPAEGVDGHRARDLLRALPDGGQKQLWRGLFLLPPGIGRRALGIWWGPARWKRFTRPIMQALRA